MIPDKILYTDGRYVTVTDSVFKVKNTSYRVNGITRCGFMVLRADRLPGAVLCIIGVLLAACGKLKLVPAGIIPDTSIGEYYVEVNTLIIWLGTAFVLGGGLMMALVREKYAVRIATAEGEKDAVVSYRKEYVTQIVDALNQAASYVRTKAASRYFTVKEA